MLVIVNAAIDHFFQKEKITACAWPSTPLEREPSKLLAITASLLNFCQIFQKRALPDLAECLCPSPNKRLWNAMSLKFVFRQLYCPTGPISKMEKKIVEESSDCKKDSLIVVRKHEFCQLNGIQLLLPSSLWNYLFLQICKEDRII